MAHVLGYARVSKDSQDLQGQRLRLEQAGAFKTFEDKISGRKFDRAGLNALLEYARPGDTLAVVRLDRLGRSMHELLTVVADLRQRGVALLSLEERIDTSSAAGELVFHLFAALAQFERGLISERTRDGIEAARARGRPIGRAPLDALKIDSALKLIDGGMKPRAAAEAVGLGRSTVYRELAVRRPPPEPEPTPASTPSKPKRERRRATA